MRFQRKRRSGAQNVKRILHTEDRVGSVVGQVLGNWEGASMPRRFSAAADGSADSVTDTAAGVRKRFALSIPNGPLS